MTHNAKMVGILAYGSLIDEPGPELEGIILDRIDDVPTPFHIEFARSSSTRGNAPTLVPIEDGGAPVKSTILVVDVPELLATDMLWRREVRCSDLNRHYVEPSSSKPNAVKVKRLENLSGIDVILYTSIGPNIAPLSAKVLAELAISSVSKAPSGKDGISYLIAAKSNGIVTPLSSAYENEILSRTATNDLSAALSSIRSRI